MGIDSKFISFDEIVKPDEKETLSHGVDFSKCQLDRLVKSYDEGKRVEIESFSPYLSDYNMVTGEIWEENLHPADAIGLEVAEFMRKRFPEARLVSLYDEYNSGIPATLKQRSASVSRLKPCLERKV